MNINFVTGSKSNEEWVKKWFKSRTDEKQQPLKSLFYEINIIANKIPKSFISNMLPTVLAACPSAGKTIMSICLIDLYLKQHPNARVLVLTHGTNVLRSQYLDTICNLKPNFTHSTDINSDAQVIVTLPHSIHKLKTLPHFDLLVVDEAHQLYFAKEKDKNKIDNVDDLYFVKTNGDKYGMVTKIIKKIQPVNQLLLTGTPSPFILRKYPIIAVTVNQLLDLGMISDVLVENATSTYDFNKEDFNSDWELKKDVAKKMSFEDTNKTLDELLSLICNRLSSLSKNSPKLYAFAKNIGWNKALGTMKKTMFACKSQEQAKQVQKYFESKNIKVALSISDTDKDSIEFAKFKHDKDCLVLIVVNRGILGFNMKELINVVDMTVSQNIDRIFQLMARVLRPNGSDKKFFFKIVPHGQEAYYSHIMTAVMCLTDEYYYTTFNGKNFLDMRVPVIKRKKSKKPTDTNKPIIDGPSVKSEIKTIEYIGLPAIRLFKDLLYKKNGVLNGYEYMNIREIRGLLLLNINYWSKEKAYETVGSKHTTFNSWAKANPSPAMFIRREGLTKEMCDHFGWTLPKPQSEDKNNWNDEDVLKVAKTCKNRGEFKKKYSGAYLHAIKRSDLYAKCIAHMDIIRENWTLEKCKQEALKYKTPTEWKLKSSKSYWAAKNHGWLDVCCEHMNVRRRAMD